MNDIISPKVAIIILNYNNWKDTLTCLESAFNIDYENFCVVVVDNGSNDNSIGYIKKWAEGSLKYIEPFPEHPYFNSLKEIKKPIEFAEFEREEHLVKRDDVNRIYKEDFICKSSLKKSEQKKLIIINTKKNLGYAGGNNVGIRFSINHLNADFFLILNNDIVVAFNLISKLLRVFSHDKSVGMCGPIEYSYKEPYNVQSAGGKFGIYTGMNKIIRNPLEKIAAVDWIIGSCILLKKDLVSKIGFFDERFFLYVEEVDYAYRLKKNGYKTIVSSETCIWHKGGAIKGDLFFFYTTRNRLLFALKHLKFYQLIVFIYIHIPKWLIYRPCMDLIQNKKINFLKYLIALKEGLLSSTKKIKRYITQIN